MLRLKNIVVHYDGVEALKDISMDVEAGTITSLIGANGAGKSTCLRAISGLAPLTAGEIWFEDKRIDGMSPEKIVELGIGHVPEGKRLFMEMSVLDNLLTGAHLRKDKDRLQQDLERVYGYFPVLREARHRRASTLSGGEQQMLAIGRGLMANPKLLLLDEPSLGLSPILTREVASIIRRITDGGVSILLIEQNATVALKLASKGYVLETGRIALGGDSKQLQNNDHVRAAYLGISPTEEARAGGAQERETTERGAPARGPSDRWQDRGPQGRWQDKGVPERPVQEGRAPYSEPFDRGAQEIREKDEGKRAVWAQDMGYLDRGTPDRWTPSRWQDREPLEKLQDRGLEGRRHDEELPERWAQNKRARDREPIVRQVQERTVPERWERFSWEDKEPPERWSQYRWAKAKKGPSRVVKRTFVTTVRRMT